MTMHQAIMGSSSAVMIVNINPAISGWLLEHQQLDRQFMGDGKDHALNYIAYASKISVTLSGSSKYGPDQKPH